MIKECLNLLAYESADCCEVHTNHGSPVVFIHHPGARTVEYAPASPARLAVIEEALLKLSQPAGAFAGPGVYHVTKAGCLTFIP